MYETGCFNNDLYKASRPKWAARFVFEQNIFLFFFEPTITKLLSETESFLSVLNE